MKIPITSSEKRKTTHCNYGVCNAIMASSLLTEEDSDFISLYCLPHFSPADEMKKQKMTKRNLLAHSCFAVISAIFLTKTSIPDWIRIPLYLLPGGVLLNAVIRCLHHSESRNLQVTKKYLKVNEDLQLLVKKCMRFIQEMEIASLGYTLTCGTSTVSRVQKIQEIKAGKCKRLRHKVLTTCLRIISVHRHISEKLLQFSPADIKLNPALCQIPIDELGPCFDENSSLDDISIATDNFCLQFLRDTSIFMHLQQSECLKFLVLSKRACAAGELLTFVEMLSSVCKEELRNLQMLYEMQQNVGDISQDGKGKKSVKTSPKQSATYKAIHSIQVHLRSALEIAVQSENDLVDGKEVLDISGVLLPQLLVHVEASKQCVNEALRCIDKKAEPADEPVERQPQSEITNLHVNTVVDYSLLDRKESYFEDQVFEAVAEELDSEDDQKKLPKSELEETRQKRIEETHHVMRELKSVLHVKTSAEEREIRKSKLFPDYIPKKVVTECAESISENCPSNLDLSVLHKDSDESQAPENRFSGHGEMHKMLPVYRRPMIPNRSRRRRNYCPKEKSECVESEKSLNNVNESTISSNFGLSSSLARQVAVAAKAVRTEMPGWRMAEESTFGDSDSDS